jgi:hypothetical protein
MNKLLLAATVALSVGMAGQAHADYAFSSSSGVLVGPSESWSFNFDGGNLENDWGSPGVGAGIVPYGEVMPAYGMNITFTGGGPIDTASIAIGNGAGCAGSTYGGTTFCTISPTGIWEAFSVGPDSIQFLAQNASFDLTQGQDYFVNIFFTGATPTGFTGAWLTSFQPTPGGGSPSVPEPAALSLVGLGLLALGTVRRRKQV